MKKATYLMVVAGLFAFASCDSPQENRAEEMEDAAEDAADDMEDAVENDTTVVVQ